MSERFGVSGSGGEVESRRLHPELTPTGVHRWGKASRSAPPNAPRNCRSLASRLLLAACLLLAVNLRPRASIVRDAGGYGRTVAADFRDAPERAAEAVDLRVRPRELGDDLRLEGAERGAGSDARGPDAEGGAQSRGDDVDPTPQPALGADRSAPAPPACRRTQEEIARTVAPAYLPSPCQFDASFGSYEREAWSCRDPGRCRLYGPYLMPEPPRYLVTSHVLRYRSLGVDARADLVVRDPALHFAGVLKNHCRDHTVALKQYATGRRILEEALAAVDPVVVSYETLMTLRGAYWKDVLAKLDVDSSRVPEFVNGNLKYEGNVGVHKMIIGGLRFEHNREKRWRKPWAAG